LSITVADLKAHLNLTGDADDVLLEGKIAAASAYVERYVGPFPDPVPAPLLEAIRQLAGHLYENREATIVGEIAQAVPFGFHDLIAPYRRWSF
jgi:hypothetical protein